MPRVDDVMSRISYAGLSDVGRVRQENEDHWVADPELGLFLVSDGIGGGLAGGLASRIVAETLPPLLRKHVAHFDNLADPQAVPCVIKALTELSNQVRNESKGQPGQDGMGATVVLTLIREMHALIGHMGDSRAYLFRDNRLEQLTKDHSIVQLLIDSGDISADEALDHPDRGRLTRYVGMDNDPLPEVRRVELADGDQLLLCSDGLTGMLSDSQIHASLRAAQSPEQSCQELIAAANDSGGNDNITAVVVRVLDVE